MQAPRYLGHLEPGMDVCDKDGDKFGSVNRVFRHEFASVGTEGSSSVGTMPREEITPRSSMRNANGVAKTS